MISMARQRAGEMPVDLKHYIRAVVEWTFTALDRLGPFENENAFLHALVIVDFLLQLAHFVKDGSGRSGEDLLALLGTRHGFPLTFSITGYRTAVAGPERLLVTRHVTQRIS